MYIGFTSFSEASGSKTIRLIACLLVLLALMIPGWAQSGRGRIEGIIVDPSGARVPDAKIQVVETQTNSTLDFATNDQGLYIAPSLPVGTYKLVVIKQGFATVVREPILIRSEVVVRVDLTIQPGTVAESVAVTGEAPILDLSTTSSPTSIGAAMVEDLPIISSGSKRNISQLLQNLPGLTSYNPNDKESATWAPRVNGSLVGNTEAFIDGGPGTGISTGRGALEEVGPSVEQVGEFSLVTNAFNAEYGGFGNWFTNITIKSGTNEFHGSVYNHYENNAMKARSFFVPRITAGNQSDGGITLGGPVVIPGIYNGRNKTFFFASEGLFFTRNGPSFEFRTIPTVEFKKGDFSKLANAAGAQIPIYDPTSTAPNGTGGFTRTTFPGNVIPVDRQTAAAKMITSFMPDPDIPGALTNNYYSRSFSGVMWPYFNNYVTTAKVDHNVSTKQKISVLYTNQVRHRQLQGQGMGWSNRFPWGTVPQPNPLDATMYQIANSWRARANHDYVFSPVVLNHVTISVDRYINLGPNATRGAGWNTKLGLKGFPRDIGAFPALTWSGGTASPMRAGAGIGNVSYEIRSRIDESLMWTRGSHSMKFGGYYARNTINTLNTGASAGAFTFTNNMTAGFNGANINTAQGHSFASFLLGAVGTASTTLTDMAGSRIPTMAFFAQDDWRVTPKLTVSYGLRWDYTQPPYEVNNKMSSFEPELQNPKAGNLLGALAFAKTYGKPLVDSWKKGFGPRLGFAYQLGSKTVLRASGGLYYATPSLAINTTGFTNAPSFSSADSYTPLYYWDTGTFPQSFATPPIMDPSFVNGQSIAWLPRTRGRLPQIVSWTVGFQRQIGSGLALDISYVGSKSTHLNIGTALNVVDAKYLSLGSLLVQPITSPAAIAAGYKEPFPGFANQTGANNVAAALKPWPQYTAVGTTIGFGGVGPDGIGRMQSLQVKATKRMSRGLTYTTYFTWMKNFTNNTPQYPLNRKMGIGVDSTAVPAVVGATWTYELPFGPGRALLRSTNPIAKRLASGWSVNGFVRYQSGWALSITGQNTLGALGWSRTANYVGGNMFGVTNPRQLNPATDRYLNPAAFANPGSYELGNLAPVLDYLRGFTSKSESIQINKSTNITERVKLDLGLDLSNPFNFHRFTNPATNISDSLNFGKVTGAGDGRTPQLTAKITF